MKFLILSTDKSILNWKSLPAKIEYLEKALEVFEIEVKNIDSKPLIIGSRVAPTWLSELIKPYFNQGYDVVALHMSNRQRQEWGIMPSLRGSNPRSGQEYGDFYFWSDENTKREGLSQFIQTCLHEFSHEYYQQTGLEDVTHWYHYHSPDITGLVKSFDWTLYQPKRMNLKQQVTLLKRVKELLTKLVGMQPTYINPFPNFPISQKKGFIIDEKLFNKNITQKWLEPNTLYKSGVHNGLDIGVPLGTEIKAPLDGRVFYSTQSPQLGNVCFFECEFNSEKTYHVFPHLKSLVELKDYKQGEAIGIVGGTGLSFGGHIHWTILKIKPIDVSHYVSLLNTKEKVLENTIDPYLWQK